MWFGEFGHVFPPQETLTSRTLRFKNHSLSTLSSESNSEKTEPTATLSSRLLDARVVLPVTLRERVTCLAEFGRIRLDSAANSQRIVQHP